jgi:hypothetical protein
VGERADGAVLGARPLIGFFTIASDFSTFARARESYNSSMSNELLAARRDRVVDRLTSDFAHGAFDVDELERRLERAQAASTPTELDAVTTDLATVPTIALVPAQRLRVVMSSIERTGPWSVPAQLAVRVVCGNVVLDLREAHLATTGTTIDVHVTMGNVEVIVPPGVAVDVGATSFLGNVEDRTRAGSATGPVVRIVGRVKLGNLDVSALFAGETRRDAWRRRWADRRAYRHWARYWSRSR